VRVLQQALNSGRVHHAWVFHGPAGVGKHTTAAAFAKVLLCHDPQTDLTGQVAACDGCESCRLFNNPDAAHPDLHPIYKELALYSDHRRIREQKQMTIPLDVLRNRLVGPANRCSQLGHNKAFIVDEAELIDQNGQNTLLKTLEEPPAGTYLILVTAHEERLLPTIRSRCQRVAFFELSDDVVARWVDEHHPELEAQRRPWVIAFARGSIGRAELAVEYGLDEWVRQTDPLLERLSARRGGGAELGPMLAKFADDFAAEWVKRHTNASKDAANKAAVRHVLGILGAACRRRIGELADGLDPGDPDAAEQRLRPWLRGTALLRDAEAELVSNVSPALLLDNLAVQWAAD